MIRRLVLETFCEQHPESPWIHKSFHGCDGGSRREVTIDYEAAVTLMNHDDPMFAMGVAMEPEAFVRAIVDAALGLDS